MKKKEEPPPPKEARLRRRTSWWRRRRRRASRCSPRRSKIPDVLPDIDLSKKVTDEADFTGKGVAGGIAKGVEQRPPVNDDQPYFEFQVEKPVMQVPGLADAALSRHAPLGGRRGRGARPVRRRHDGPRRRRVSFKVLKSTHDLFTTAVRNALPTHAVHPGRSRRAQGEAARAAAVHVLAHKVANSPYRRTRRLWICHCSSMWAHHGPLRQGYRVSSWRSCPSGRSPSWSRSGGTSARRRRRRIKFAPEFSQFLEEDNLTEAIKLAESYKKSHVARVLGGALGEVKPADSGRLGHGRRTSTRRSARSSAKC